jgi:predicted phage tail protein
MVKVRLHGDIGEKLGKEWNLQVDSVAEAFQAIDVNTGKFTKYFISKVEEDAKYEILINQRDLWMPDFEKLPEKYQDLKKEHIENLYKSEAFMNFSNGLQTIDVVPIIEGAGGGGGGGKSGGSKGGGGKSGGKGFFAIFLALVVGIFAPGIGLSIAIPAIIGLLALGVSMLMMKPPPMVSPQSIANPSADFEASPSQGGEPSYLFNGPVNTQGEGGPVPIGYGRLIIGSHQVFSSYDQLYRIQSRTNIYSNGSPPADAGQRNFPGQSYTFDLKGKALQLRDIVGNSLERSSLGSK